MLQLIAQGVGPGLQNGLCFFCTFPDQKSNEMRIKRFVIFFWLIAICIPCIRAQILEKPNCGLKSHETLEILSIEEFSGKTIVTASIENRISGGNFCADKNIYLIEPDGKKLKLIRSTGIPVCPGSYIFKSIGEKLQFTLEFPSLRSGTKWIDIVEECASNCFWFYGVTLDNELNKKLDNVFLEASEGNAPENIILFKTLLDSIDNQNIGIEGLLYINIINAAIEDNDKINSMTWYRRLASSHAPRLKSYIKYLNDKGIMF